MAQESETRTTQEPASKAPQEPSTKELFTRLAEVGEDAIHRIAEIPGLTRLSETVNNLRSRVDELQRRVRGLDDLERRVAELEQRVDKLSAKPAPRSRSKKTGASGAGGTSSSP
jgi:polyhydroxyalkanoate synthesis regulator phasin